MKKQFPGVLWLLPIMFGLLGGLTAALISGLKYKASWWELFLAGCIVTFVLTTGWVVLWLVVLNV